MHILVGAFHVKHSYSDTSLHRELKQLHREMESIRLQCDALVNAHWVDEQRVRQQVNNAKELMKVH